MNHPRPGHRPVALRSFRADDRAGVIALWRRTDLVRPWNDPDRDIDRKLAVDDGLLLVAEPVDAPPASAGRTAPSVPPAPAATPSDAPDRGEGLVGTVMVGYDGHRGWINYLAVDPEHQGRGLGRRLVHEAERRLVALGCPKVNLMVRSTNPDVVAFYRALGYEVDAVTALGKRLIADR